MDHDKVFKLLGIVKECAGHTGKLAAISNAAMKELFELNDKLKVTAIKANPPTPVEPEPETRDEEPNVRPSVYPGDSETATIADRRI